MIFFQSQTKVQYNICECAQGHLPIAPGLVAISMADFRARDPGFTGQRFSVRTSGVQRLTESLQSSDGLENQHRVGKTAKLLKASFFAQYQDGAMLKFPTGTSDPGNVPTNVPTNKAASVELKCGSAFVRLTRRRDSTRYYVGSGRKE